jgi:hypothetical protein
VFKGNTVQSVKWPIACVGCGTSDLSHSIKYPADLVYKRENIDGVLIPERRRIDAMAELYLCSSCEKKSIQESKKKVQRTNLYGRVLLILGAFFSFSSYFILDMFPLESLLDIIIGFFVYSFFVGLLWAGYIHMGYSKTFQNDLIDDPYLRYVYLAVDGFLFTSDKYNSQFIEENSRIETYVFPELFTKIAYPFYKGKLTDSLVIGCATALMIVAFVAGWIIVILGML